MLNSDYIKNFFLLLLGVGMFAVVIMVAMRAIDKVAERDCVRGIVSACQYVPAE